MEKILDGFAAFITLVLLCALPTPLKAGNQFGCDLFAAAVVTDATYVAVGDRGKIFISKDAAGTGRHS
jgi:hypothetical protein